MHLVLDGDAAAAALAGGTVLGAATIAKLVINGNILGISGIVNGLCGVLVDGPEKAGPWGWRVAFASGFIAAGGLLRVVAPQTLQAIPVSMSWLRVLSAGALVGSGSSLGNGCTSGHGISGITRISPRSIAATAAFMATGALTASLSTASAAFTALSQAADAAGPPMQAATAITASAVLVGSIGLLTLCMYAASGHVGPSSRFDMIGMGVEFGAALAFGLALGISGMGRPEQVLCVSPTANIGVSI